MKGKYHTVIPIDIGKAFDKTQYLSMINAQETGYRRPVPQHNKSHVDNIMLDGGVERKHFL